MGAREISLLAAAVLAAFPLRAAADSVPLGAAANFAILAGTTVVNSDVSTIIGDVGGGTSVTGFNDGSTVIGGIYTGNALTQQGDPLGALSSAYNYAAGLTATNLLPADLDGLTLTPGVYAANSSVFLTGTLTLDDQGDPNALFVFQIDGALVADAVSTVQTINGGTMPGGSNVFWQVDGAATLGTGSTFQGNILANGNITVDAGATLSGSALTLGALTLDGNFIEVQQAQSVPLPRIAVMGLALAPFVWFLRRRFAQ
jgi:hypothetical protein